MEIEPPRLLAYTWEPSWVESPPTNVRITLEARPGGTLVTWAHTGFRGHTKALADHSRGLPTVVAWLASYLEEGRRARPQEVSP